MYSSAVPYLLLFNDIVINTVLLLHKMFNYKTIKVTSFHDPSGSCNFCFHDPSGLVYWNLAERRLGQRGNDRGRERETEREGEKEGERKRQTEGGSERERERETVSSSNPDLQIAYWGTAKTPVSHKWIYQCIQCQRHSPIIRLSWQSPPANTWSVTQYCNSWLSTLSIQVY